MLEIQTCATSLMNVGRCCDPDCAADAVSACLDDDLVEHTFCDRHASVPTLLGRKPLIFDPLWSGRP